MSLVINHNMMAANTARNLNAHYAGLAKSVQRLSTGLRINSAADDAAGLAIRELQRADISALHQGARNANDAISMIQTADGALQVIDEKLIRMKELAEQAATGTYDSTQRLMIESEYQAMASEITRIANATDFNGIHLLNGNLSSRQHDGSGLNAAGKMKIHFGSGNDSSEDYYYIRIGDCTAGALGVGSGHTWERVLDGAVAIFNHTFATRMDALLAQGTITQSAYDFFMTPRSQGDMRGIYEENLKIATMLYDKDVCIGAFGGVRNSFVDAVNNGEYVLSYPLPEEYYTMPASNFYDMTEREQQKIQYAVGRWSIYSSALHIPETTPDSPGGSSERTIEEPVRQAIAAAATDAWEGIELRDYGGRTIATQEDAQLALNALSRAIEAKDKTRADLGAVQNRLENTITNLNTQAENLQAAESRISDVDVATEMTEFVRRQILTQSAVAMLSQANSMPQMAMQIIGG